MANQDNPAPVAPVKRDPYQHLRTLQVQVATAAQDHAKQIMDWWYSQGAEEQWAWAELAHSSRKLAEAQENVEAFMLAHRLAATTGDIR